MMTETSNLVGQALGQGRYQVKRKLGEGGMAFVLLAVDTNVGVDVVLKVPKPAMLADPEFVHRFKREIRSMVELTHPHIVKIKDVGEHEGMPFYVMDLLTGGSLEDRFEPSASKDKKKPMPAESLAVFKIKRLPKSARRSRPPTHGRRRKRRARVRVSQAPE